MKLLPILGLLAVLAAGVRGAEPAVVSAVPTTPFAAPDGTWTLVALPDTQHYLEGNPQVFRRQAEWIAAHKASHRILFVAHEGDITSNNSAKDWAEVRSIMNVLGEAGVPYSLAVGNKDLGEGGKAQDRTTRINDYFNAKDYGNSKESGFCNAGCMENSWQMFDTPWGPHLLLSLEFGPRDEVVAWAGRVIAEHPRHRVIVVTHACVYHDGKLHGADPKQGANPKHYGIAQAGGVNDGVDLWAKLLSRYPNVGLVLNGHATGPGAARIARTGEAGNAVHLLLANFQRGVNPDRGYGGGGFLRLLRFLPDGRTVEVKTYSPWYDSWLTDDAQQFTIEFPAPPPLKVGLIGDSTMCDYPATSHKRGWGQLLPEWLAPGTVVINEARGGKSTKTFPADRWQRVLAAKPDFILIQFGHNDSHAKDKPEATDAATDYRENLRRYVAEARAAGAEPILVTPVRRRVFRKGALTNELTRYADAMKAVAAESGVKVIDLHATSGELYTRLGEKGSEGFTANVTDDADRPGRDDRTHFTPEGAKAMARLVADGLRGIAPRLLPADDVR